MNDTELRRTLQAALFLIVIGLAAIGIADHWNWRDLAGAGGIVVGYGGGILQGKQNNSADVTTGNAPVTINQTDPT